MSATPIWTGPRLLTPMTVEALVLGQPNLGDAINEFMQAGVDYTQLHFDASPTPEPFASAGGIASPAAGVALHWTVPVGLRSGHLAEETAASVEDPGASDGASDEVEFPLLPNRWLVVRAVSPVEDADGVAPALAAWLLRSDAADDMLGRVPVPDPDSDAKYIWIGVPLALTEPIDDPPSTTRRLYSMAPGDPAFAVVYQSAQGVLGFHDDMTDVPAGSVVSYTVIGFYNPAEWDPLLAVDDDSPTGFATEEEWQAVMNQMHLQVGDGTDTALDDAQAAWAAWASDNGVDPSGLPEAQQTLPAQLLVFGSLQMIQWDGPDALYEPNVPPSGHVSVAVGNNATEALGAWLNTQIADRNLPNYSAERLIAALMTGTLTTFMNDIAGFEQVQAGQRFGGSPSGSRTVVALPTSTRSSQTAIPLDPDQTAALTDLNAAEDSRDFIGGALASRKWELFGAQWKLTQQPDNVTVQQAIDDLSKQIDSLNAMYQTAVDDVAGKRTALDTLLGDSYVASVQPTDAFQAPNDPVVLIAAAESDDKLVQRDAQNRDVALDCRMTGQTLTGFELTVESSGPYTVDTDALAAGLKLDFFDHVGLPKEARALLLESFLLDPGVVTWLARLWLDVADPDPAIEAVEEAIANLQAGVRAAADLDDALSAQLMAEVTGFIGTAPDPLANQSWAQPWTPVYLDWRVSWHPNSTTPQDALRNWQLGDIDLEWQSSEVSPTAFSYDGRTLLNSDAPAILARRIDSLLTQDNLQIEDFMRTDLEDISEVLATADMVTQSVSGLTARLIQRQLNKAFGNQGEGETPDDASLPTPPISDELPFQPLRSGHMAFDRAWLIDAWGQVLKTEVDGGIVVPHRAESVVTPGGSANQTFVQLAPRLAQSARLDFQLVDAAAPDPAPPSNSADATSPICGYVAPNHLDGGLLVFDASGVAQGEILPIVKDSGTGVRWDAAPGLDVPLGAGPNLENAHLQALVTSILEQAEAGVDALGEVLDLMDGVTYLSNPDWDAGSNLSILLGQVLAVVRVSVQLQLAGDPSYDQGYDNTGDMVTLDFTSVSLPLRIGDIALKTNGVVGYYLNDDYTRINAVYGYTTAAAGLRRAMMHGPEAMAQAAAAAGSVPAAQAPAESAPAGSGYVVLDSIIDIPAQRHTQGLGTDDPPAETRPHMLTVLLNPSGQMPGITGFLPTQSLTLAPGPVSQAMNNLAFTTRAGPLLVNPDTVRMPLPADILGTWNFVWRDSVTTWADEPVQNDDGRPRFAPVPRQLYWGWLELTGAFAPQDREDSEDSE